MKIFFITSNASKVQLANERLNRYEIEVVQHKADLIEPQVFDVEAVAAEKAKQLLGIVKTPFVVEDSGMYIERLRGFPGALMKPVLDTIGDSGLIKLMSGETNRNALVKSALAYCNPEKNLIKTITGNFKGSISESLRGDATRGWMVARIFVPAGETKTLAEMDDAEWQRHLDDSRKDDHYEKLGKWLKSNSQDLV